VVNSWNPRKKKKLKFSEIKIKWNTLYPQRQFGWQFSCPSKGTHVGVLREWATMSVFSLRAWHGLGSLLGFGFLAKSFKCQCLSCQHYLFFFSCSKTCLYCDNDKKKQHYYYYRKILLLVFIRTSAAESTQGSKETHILWTGARCLSYCSSYLQAQDNVIDAFD